MNLSLRFMNQFRESKAKIHESKSSFVNLSLRFILFIFVSLFLRFMNLSLKIHDIPLIFMNLIFLRFMNLMWRHPLASPCSWKTIVITLAVVIIKVLYSMIILQ